MSPPLWSLEPHTVLAIVVMGIATYACRGGGYWLFSKISPSPLLRAIMHYIPGTLFVSYVVPTMIGGGLQPVVGSAATVIVMIYARNLGLAIAVGVLASYGVWVFR